MDPRFRGDDKLQKLSLGNKPIIIKNDLMTNAYNVSVAKRSK